MNIFALFIAIWSVSFSGSGTIDSLLAHLRASSDYSSFVYPTFEAKASLNKAALQFANACPDDAYIYRSRDRVNNVIARVFDSEKPVDQGCLELRLTEGAGGKIPIIEAATFQTIDVRLGLAKIFIEQLSSGIELQPNLIFEQNHGGTIAFLAKTGDLLKGRAQLDGNEEGIINKDSYTLTKKGVSVRFSSADRNGPRPGLSFGYDFTFKKVKNRLLIEDVIRR